VVAGADLVGLRVRAIDTLGSERDGLREEGRSLALVGLGGNVGHLDEHLVILVAGLLATVPDPRTGQESGLAFCPNAGWTTGGALTPCFRERRTHGDRRW
jgi:hypothetical protein